MNKVYYLIFTVYMLSHAWNACAQGNVVVHAPPGLALLYSKKPEERRILPKKPAPATKAIKTTTATMVGSPLPGGTLAVAPKPVTGVTKTLNAEPPHVSPPLHLVSSIRHEKVIYSGKGFRVQIYYGPDRNMAMQIKSEFMRAFPDVRTYLSYKSPYFRVKVGNYRSRSDAVGMLREANSMYSPSMIVPDIITVSTF